MPRSITKQLVSIIIPVFNTDLKYLDECIESVMKQTYENLEVIIVDDGSKAKIALACDSFSRKYERITVIHKKNAGVSAARNKGIEHAKGDYIMFVDSDDVVSEYCVERLLGNIETANSEISIGQLSLNKDLINKAGMLNTAKVLNKDLALEALLYTDGVPTGPFVKLISRNVFEEIHFNESLSFAEDLEYNFRAFNKATNITVTHDKLYFYRESEGGVMRTGYKHKRMDGLMAVNIILAKAKKSEKKRIVSAAEYRSFMEAMFIGIAIPIGVAYGQDRDACNNAIKLHRRSVALNRSGRKSIRLLALISVISIRFAIAMYRFKFQIAKKIKGLVA